MNSKVSHWYMFLCLMLILSACAPNIRFSSKKEIERDKKESVNLHDIKKADEKYSRSGIPNSLFGKASYYSDKFEGKLTASGQPYNKRKLTAAHRTLPFGVIVKVRNLSNNKEVIVRINDRGPFIDSRVIDLSYRAAQELDMIRDGVVDVEIIPLDDDIPDMTKSPMWDIYLNGEEEDE